MDIAWCVDFDCQGRDPGTSLNNLFRSHQTWSEITKATHVIRHRLCGMSQVQKNISCDARASHSTLDLVLEPGAMHGSNRCFLGMGC